MEPDTRSATGTQFRGAAQEEPETAFRAACGGSLRRQAARDPLTSRYAPSEAAWTSPSLPGNTPWRGAIRTRGVERFAPCRDRAGDRARAGNVESSRPRSVDPWTSRLAMRVPTRVIQTGSVRRTERSDSVLPLVPYFRGERPAEHQPWPFKVQHPPRHPAPSLPLLVRLPLPGTRRRNWHRHRPAQSAADPAGHGDGRESRPTGTVPEGFFRLVHNWN